MIKPLRDLVFVIAMLLIGGQVMAQPLPVRVLDSRNAAPVPDALIAFRPAAADSVSGSWQTVQTDSLGRAFIVFAGQPLQLSVTAFGYEPLLQQFDSLPAATLTLMLSRSSAYSLDEVVVTGTLQPVRLQDALAQYRVISRGAMDAQGSATLADALTHQLNMSLGNDGVLGANLRLQGLDGNKVKVLVDGLPVNGRENGNIDLSQLNLNNAARVEIVQGPMSVVYGSDALGGVINIITNQKTSARELRAEALYESAGRYNTSLDLSHRLGPRGHISLGGGRNFFEGWHYTDSTEPHRQLLFKPKEQYLAHISGRYQTLRGVQLQLASDLVRERVSNRGPAYIDPYMAFAFDEYYRTTRLMNRLLLDGKAGANGRWQSQNAYNIYQRSRNSYRKDLVSLEQLMQGTQDTARYDDLSMRGAYSRAWPGLELTTGYDLNLQWARDSKIAGREQHIGDYAAYASASVPMLKRRLSLQAGLRASVNTLYEPPVMPNLNLLFKATDALRLRASWARGFRAPTLKELYLEFIDQNHHITGNKSLRAESSDHLQASASWQVFQKGNDRLSLVLTGFYNDVRDGISLVKVFPDQPFDNNYSYGNLSHMRNASANAQAEWQWRELYVQLGYAYRHTTGREGAYEAFGQHEANGMMRWFWKKPAVAFNVFYKYTGRQPGLQFDITGATVFAGHIPAFHQLDVSLSRSFWQKRIQWVAGVKNMMDVTVLQAAGTGNAPVASIGPHTGSGASFVMLPRRFFTSLRLRLR